MSGKENNEQKKEARELQVALEKALKAGQYLITIHRLEEGMIRHEFVMKEFPDGDLLPVVGMLEREFTDHLKSKRRGMYEG